MVRYLLIALLFFGVRADAQLNRQALFHNTNGWYCTASDADACAFLTRLHLNGYDTNNSEQTAFNNYFIAIKAHGAPASDWAGMWLTYGGTANTHKLDGWGVYDLTFMVSPTHNSTGVLYKGPATSGYAKTGVIASSVMSLTGFTFLWYSGTSGSVAGSAYEMGAEVSNSQLSLLSIGGGTGTSSTTYTWSTSQSLNPTIGGTSGLFIITRTSSTFFGEYRNGSLLGSNTTTSTGTRPNIEYYLGRDNAGGTPAGNPSDKECRFAGYIKRGLTATEITNITNDINTLETALGRNTF